MSMVSKASNAPIYPSALTMSAATLTARLCWSARKLLCLSRRILGTVETRWRWRCRCGIKGRMRLRGWRDCDSGHGSSWSRWSAFAKRGFVVCLFVWPWVKNICSKRGGTPIRTLDLRFLDPKCYIESPAYRSPRPWDERHWQKCAELLSCPISIAPFHSKFNFAKTR